MKMVFQAFYKKIFSAKHERLTRTLLIDLIVFWGLYIADFRLRIAPSVLYLTVTTFTAGVMWQALSSEDNAVELLHMTMLPLKGWEFAIAYTASLGFYTFLTKTAALLSVLLAVSFWGWVEILGSILCAVSAILIVAVAFWGRKYWYTGHPFYRQENTGKRTVKGHQRHSVWLYFFRYLKTHKNYMVNMIIMWCVACVLPSFLERMDSLYMLPIGFAILSLNTPVCILVSCDPALEQAIRFLPGQKKTFYVPYGLFIFLCNMTANMIFLLVLQIQIGGATFWLVMTSVFFALQSAICSVLLERFCPIRGWKIESDLWHHPRKYIVPTAMLFLAVVVAAMPVIVRVLVPLQSIEILILFMKCRRS